MDVENFCKEIDKEVSSRTSDKFGIKVGGELYKELARAGKIKLATFSIFGTGAFPEELPAYGAKYFIFVDWELDDYAFEVGVPRT